MAKQGQPIQIEPMQFAQSQQPDAVTNQFKLHASKFASLGTKEDFTSLKEGLIEINIEQALNHLSEEGYLEITLPVTGMTDFLSQEPVWQNMPQQFPSVIAMNGFGAHMDGEQNGHFPKPYYILAKDLIGNEYEILVNAQGQVEVPENGLGLFSVLSSMTMMFSYEQLQGQGLESLAEFGAMPGKLYLLPPPGLEAQLEPIIRTSHLDDYLNRQIDFEMRVPIELHTQESDQSIETTLTNMQGDFGTFLHVDVNGQKPNAKKPYKISLSFDEISDVDFSLTNPSMNAEDLNQHGWQQIGESSFEKSIGLSDFAKFALVRNIFSEFDFTKSMLQGEAWGLKHTNGFNDFGLSLEAIGPYYDLMVDAVVQNKIPGNYIFDHVPDENLANLDLSYAEFDAQDMATIDDLTDSLHAFDFAPLNDMLSGQNTDFFAEFDVFVKGELEGLPNVHASLQPIDGSGVALSDFNDFHIPDLDQVQFDDSVLAGHDANGYELSNFIDLPDSQDVFASSINEPVALKPGHQATTIHYDDIMDLSEAGDVIGGFDVGNDKIDLSGLLDKMPGATISDVQLKPEGQDIHISITNDDGQAMPVATLVGAASPDLPDDLSAIIHTPDLG